MSDFVIIRHKKLKSRGHVQAAIHHNDRTTTPENADPTRAHLNHFSGGGLATLDRNIASVTQASTARDPVQAIEYIVTASPEAMQHPDFDREGYFRAAREYLDTLVGADNLVHEAVHYDESNPHAHFVYTPIITSAPGTRRRSVVAGKNDDGTLKREVREFATPGGRSLNAKKFTGRDASIQLQTTFAAEVGAKFGLRRGVERSTAKHKTIKAFYGELRQGSAEIEAQNEQIRELRERHGQLLQEMGRIEAQHREARAAYDDRVKKNSLIEERGRELLEWHEQISGAAAARKMPAAVTITAADLTPRQVAKNFLGRPIVESPDQVAERLTTEVRRHHIPLREAAEREQSAEIRASGWRVRAERLEAEIEPLRPIVEGLDAQGVAAVTALAGRERAATLERAEQARRVEHIKILRGRDGPQGTFGRIAHAEVARRGGNASGVDWGAIERDAINQIIDDGWTPRQAGETIQQFSPGQVGRDPAIMAQELEAMPDTAEPRAPKPRKPAPGHGLGF